MRLLCLSDLHGHLPDLRENRIYAADVAVIAGDVTPVGATYYGGNLPGLLRQREWIIDTFIPWLQTLPVNHVVLTWGNHDHIGEAPGLLPKSVWPSNMHMLVNEGVTIDGVSFYGIPQTPRFFDWAFNVDDTPEGMGRYWDRVPDDTQVLISHGPPRGVVDCVGGDFRTRAGSVTQESWLKSNASNVPMMVVCGHIHGSGGSSGTCGDTRIHNVAIMNEAYQPVRKPMVIDLVSLITPTATDLAWAKNHIKGM